jgi:cell wall-associated NlpC family hydrolase
MRLNPFPGCTRLARITALTGVSLVAMLVTVPAAAQYVEQGTIEAGELPSLQGAGAPQADAASNSLIRIQEKALSLIGVRYRYGGSSPASGFDCSGFVQYVLRTAAGMRVGRTAASQAEEGRPVDRAQLQAGDLVFFNTLGAEYSHVGVYLGNDEFVHAPSRGGRVRIESMDSPYWLARFTKAARLQAVTAPRKSRQQVRQATAQDKDEDAP